MSDTQNRHDELYIYDCEKQRIHPQPAHTIKALIVTAICLGYFMVILDTTVVNVALPNIKQLGATTIELQWIVDGYGLVFASFLLTAGALGDRLGSKQVFASGLVVFTIASALCGAASSLWMLQIARVIQGAGAALLVPASLALLNHSFADPMERARVIGIWGGIAGIAAGAGPVLVGGVLGVALLGSFVSERGSFVAGMHAALGIAGGAFLLGNFLSFFFIQRRQPHEKGSQPEEISQHSI